VVLTTTARSGKGWLLQVVSGSAKGQSFKMPSSGAAAVGRQRGALLFSDDVHVSPQHAIFMLRDYSVIIRDENSTSGVYVAIRTDAPLGPKALFTVGDRLFRFSGALEKPRQVSGKPWPYGAPATAEILYVVEELLVGMRPGRAALTAGPVLTVGQTGCDLSFPGDTQIAPRHCELAVGSGGAILKDTSGGMGVFVRLPPGVEHPLSSGDRIRIGGQVISLTT
jgi:pSer/pThr/pTyr-binding forkhead associated (FHA) protein